MIKPVPYMLLLIILVFLCSTCKTDEEPTVQMEIQFEDDPEGQWYFGDFHVHATGASNDTGGNSTPAAIKTKALEVGLDFVILTDHSNSTGSDPSTTDELPALFNMGPEFVYWSVAEQLTIENEFLMICGNEISPVAEESLNLPVGHIGCIPRSLVGFDTLSAFIDRPKGAVSGADALQQSIDRGCFSIINHPYNLLPWIQYDWTSYDYDAIEIWNGTLGFDGADNGGRNAWICDLLAGREVVPIGGSDCHRVFTDTPGSGLDPALGFPMTGVFAAQLEWGSIMQGLESGMVMICEGDSRLYIDSYRENGERVAIEEAAILRVRGFVDANSLNPVLIVNHTTSCIDNRPSTIFSELIEDEQLNITLTPGQSFDEYFTINPTKGVFSAQIISENAHYNAFSRALVVD